MSFAFLKFFSKAKVNELNDSIKTQLIQLCPETATAAELASMDEQYSKLTEKLESFRVTMQKELGEAELAKKAFNKNLEISEILQARIDKGENVEANTEALNEIIEQLTQSEIEVKREVEEAELAKANFEEFKDIVAQYGEKLKTARNALNTAKAKVERAKIKQMKAEANERQVKENAGILKNISATNTVLDTFNKLAEDAEIKANAAEHRASVLGTPSKSNSIINEIKNSLDNGKPVESPTEKLSKFKKF